MVIIRLAYAANLPTPEEALRSLEEDGGDAAVGLADATEAGPGGATAATPTEMSAKIPGSVPGSSERTPPQAALTGTEDAVPPTLPQAAPEAPPEPTPIVKSRPVLATFSDVLALADEKREGFLRKHLSDDVRLVRFETGRIEINPKETAPADLAGRLTSFLNEQTDIRWTVSVSRNGDEATTREISAGAAIEEYRNSVLATREEISRLQRDNGLISTSQYEALVAETDALAQRVRDLDATLQDRTNAVRALESSLGLTPRLAAAALRLHADIEFAALVKEMSERAADLSQARSKYGEAHPEVLTAREGHEAASAEARRRAAMLTGLTDAELSALDLSHVGNRAALLSDLVTSEAQRAGLAAELAALTDRLRTAEARRVELIEPAARLEDLQRDFAVAEAVFASAMARSQTTKTDLYASYPLVQVLEDPSLPVDPTSPKRKLAAAAGIAATVFLLIGLTLGWIRRPLIDRLLAKDDHDLVMVPAE